MLGPTRTVESCDHRRSLRGGKIGPNPNRGLHGYPAVVGGGTWLLCRPSCLRRRREELLRRIHPLLGLHRHEELLGGAHPLLGLGAAATAATGSARRLNGRRLSGG